MTEIFSVTLCLSESHDISHFQCRVAHILWVQLIYGFLKPCIINRTYAPLNSFNEDNSIIYDEPNQYAQAMEKGIKLTKEEYSNMQEKLKTTVDGIYKKSLENLKGMLEK